MVVALGLVLPRAVALAGDHGDYPLIAVIGAEEIHHRLRLAGGKRQGGVDLLEEPGGGLGGGRLDNEAGAEVSGEREYTGAGNARFRMSETLASGCRKREVPERANV